MTSANQLYARANRRIFENLQQAYGAPVLGMIRDVNPEQETMSVIHHGGLSKDVRVLHPFIGNTHWHRVGGDAGQKVLLQVRQATKTLEAVAHYQSENPKDNVAARRIAAYKKSGDTYRPLAQGEQEIVSAGYSQTYWGRRPVLDQRAGYVRSWLNQDRLEAGARSVLHVRQLATHVPTELGDEERFGAVQRPDDAKQAPSSSLQSAPQSGGAGASKSTLAVKWVIAPASPTPPSPQNVSAETPTASSVQSTQEPAKEYVRILRTTSGVLSDWREGHVTDVDGNFITGKFNKNLRANWKVYGAMAGSQQGSQFMQGQATTGGSGTETFEMQVDEDGNWYVGLPQTASEGLKFEIPSGKISITSGTQTSSLSLDGVQNMFNLVSSQQGTVKTDSELKIHSTKVKLGNTYASVHKAVKTQVKKGSEVGLHGGLTGGHAMEAGLNTATVAARGLLSAVHGAVAAVPLTPGAIVSLMGIANNVIAIALHSVVPTVKILKGTLGGTYAAAWDTYESSEVELS